MLAACNQPTAVAPLCNLIQLLPTESKNLLLKQTQPYFSSLSAQLVTFSESRNQLLAALTTAPSPIAQNPQTLWAKEMHTESVGACSLPKSTDGLRQRYACNK